MGNTAYSILLKERRDLVLSLSFTGSLVFCSAPALILHFILAADKADENLTSFPFTFLISYLALFGFFSGIGLLWENPTSLRLARLLPVSTRAYYRKSVYASALFFFAPWSGALLITAFTSFPIRYVLSPLVLSTGIYYATLFFRDLALFLGSKYQSPDLINKIIRNILIFMINLPILLFIIYLLPGNLLSLTLSDSLSIILLSGLLGAIGFHIYFGHKAAGRYCGYHSCPGKWIWGSKSSYMMAGSLASHVRLALCSISAWIFQLLMCLLYYLMPSEESDYIGVFFAVFLCVSLPIYFTRYKWMTLFFSGKDQKRFFTIVNAVFLIALCSIAYTLDKIEIPDFLWHKPTERLDSEPKDVPLETIRFMRESSSRFDKHIKVKIATESRTESQDLCSSYQYGLKYGQEHTPSPWETRTVYFNQYAIRPWEQDLEEALSRADTVCKKIWGIGIDKEALARVWLSGSAKPGEYPDNKTGNRRESHQRRHQFFDAFELELGKAGVKAASMQSEIRLLLLLTTIVLFQLLARGVYRVILGSLFAISIFIIFFLLHIFATQFQPTIFLTTVFSNTFQDNGLLYWLTLLILLGLSTLAVWTKDYRKLLK